MDMSWRGCGHVLEGQWTCPCQALDMSTGKYGHVLEGCGHVLEGEWTCPGGFKDMSIGEYGHDLG